MTLYRSELFSDFSIRKAISFITAELTNRKVIKISDYYNSLDPDFIQLYQKMQLNSDDCEIEFTMALLDEGIASLDSDGTIMTKSLDGILPDGEKDIEIQYL